MRDLSCTFLFLKIQFFLFDFNTRQDGPSLELSLYLNVTLRHIGPLDPWTFGPLGLLDFSTAGPLPSSTTSSYLLILPLTSTYLFLLHLSTSFYLFLSLASSSSYLLLTSFTSFYIHLLLLTSFCLLLPPGLVWRRGVR